mgnify:FL=1
MTRFYQSGKGRGKKILLVGESPSPRGWYRGKACRNRNGELLPTGRRINKLLEPFNLLVDECGFAELCQCVLKDRKMMRARAKKDWSVFLKHLKKSNSKLIIILGVETTNVFSGLCGYALKTGEISKFKFGTKTYSVLPIYHPSPINPKNRAKNKKIMFHNTKKLKTLFM